jgi:hypothetical protein
MSAQQSQEWIDSQILERRVIQGDRAIILVSWYRYRWFGSHKVSHSSQMVIGVLDRFGEFYELPALGWRWLSVCTQISARERRLPWASIDTGKVEFRVCANACPIAICLESRDGYWASDATFEDGINKESRAVGVIQLVRPK